MSKKRKQKKKLQSNVQTKPLVKERNTVALNPLLKKSAVHQTSTKAQRQANKVNLKKTWFERVAVFAAPGQSHVFLPAL